MTPVILASKSAARAALLAGAGVRFEAVNAEVDETLIKTRLLARGAAPGEIATALAREKAMVVSGRCAGLVIGADQTLDLDGELYDKAETLDEAKARLSALRGRSHQLHAALAVATDGEVIWSEISTATLTMRPFTDVFLDGYLQRNGPRLLASVGCYELEGEGVQLFEQIAGDYFSILGLPLLGLLGLLRELGVMAR
jgi:septum formation protein